MKDLGEDGADIALNLTEVDKESGLVTLAREVSGGHGNEILGSIKYGYFLGS